MERKAVSVMIQALLLTSMLALAFNIQQVKASETIYIRPEDSIDPSTAPIQPAYSRNSVPPPTEWNKTYGGTSTDRAVSAMQTLDGGYIVAGYTHSFGVGYYSDFYLVKTDDGGNMQWNKTCGSSKDEVAYSVVQTSDEGYAIAGYTDSLGAGLKDFWLVKFAPEPLQHDVAITDIMPSKSIVGQGYSTKINVTVANQGDYTETFNVTVYSGDRFYDPFDVWNYTGAWTYYAPWQGAQGYVSVSDGMLHVSGYYDGQYHDGGLTTIKEFNYPITVETKLRSNSALNSPGLDFGPYWEPGFITMCYDVSWGGWVVGYTDTTGNDAIFWGVP